MENTPPNLVQPGKLDSLAISTTELLSEQENYFKNILGEQRRAVAQYEWRKRLFLALGGLIVLGVLVWTAFRPSSIVSAGSLLSSFITFGSGLVITSLSAFPQKEIANRRGKVITYESLLDSIYRLRTEGGKTAEDIARIEAKFDSAMEHMLKEC